MRIYDNKNPEGKKVDRGNASICPECQGRDGRHVLSRQGEEKTDKNGHRHVTYSDKPCTRR